MVMAGVSSIQFMDDALKEISCKLGCRDLRSGQVREEWAQILQAMLQSLW